MDSLRTFLQQQITLLPQSGTYISLINNPKIGPVRAMEELELLHRQVQCISLDTIEEKNLPFLADALDDFLKTGFDVVLTVGSVEILNKYLNVLIDWKNRHREKNSASEEKKRGMVFLLCNAIDRTTYPNLLQNLVDFEFPVNQGEET